MIKSQRTTAVVSKLPSHTLAHVSGPASCTEISPVSSRHESKWSSEGSGFLGPTSFSATVQHDSLAEEPKVVTNSSTEIDVDKPVQLQTGVQVLMQLPGEEECQSLMEWYLDNVVVVGAHKLSRRLTLKALWLSYRNLLRGQRDAVDLEIEVSENGSIPLKQIDDPMEWIESFSGANTSDLVGIAVAFGLHCYQGAPRVTLHSEQTKTLSACIFWSDNELSMFMGRPPSLSHRYYSCPPPLDLDDETLMRGGAELERDIRSLDQNGWNTQGRVFEATIIRMDNAFREGQAYKLLEEAREMLDLTVFLWLERDRSTNRKHDYDYMIMSYGMPCIGILCTEFLKQAKNPKAAEVKLPCSEIVQNLSMMIGLLDWIQPSAGNYKLCCRNLLQDARDQGFTWTEADQFRRIHPFSSLLGCMKTSLATTEDVDKMGI
ncbi:hypothetical protein B7463_g5296, partial [Scytalidium lignicola]